MMNARMAIPVLGLVAALTACSNSPATQGNGGSGGAQGSGGTTAQGGSATGGGTGTAGQGGKSAAGGSGGSVGSVVTTGGTSAHGGAGGTVSPSGGSIGNGGTRATGGSAGSSSAGGATGGSGGSAGGGGNPGLDAAETRDAPIVNPGLDALSPVDTSSTGGKVGLGGTTSTGGQSGSGGTTNTGGNTGAGGGSGVKTAGCGKTITHQDAKTQQTLQSGGASRYYLIYTPTTYDPNTPLPLVFALHGMNMNNWWAANDTSGFKLIEATANKAIIVYPQGTGDAPGTTSKWGGITSSWAPGATGADDKFIDALLASVEDTYCVDTSRVFVTGFSMGGWMTDNFACDHAKVFRAFAPVAGWGPGDMQTGHGTKPSCSVGDVAVPIRITQGSADTTVTPENGTNSRNFWIGQNGCSSPTTPVFSTSAQATCVSSPGCKTGLPVDFCTHNGGHMVPSNAGTYIWEFFNSFN